jgi:hypothetical protein
MKQIFIQFDDDDDDDDDKAANFWAYLSGITTSGSCRWPLQIIRGLFETFVDWRQCIAVMQREAVTVMPSCSGGGNAVVT